MSNPFLFKPRFPPCLIEKGRCVTRGKAVSTNFALLQISTLLTNLIILSSCLQVTYNKYLYCIIFLSWCFNFNGQQCILFKFTIACSLFKTKLCNIYRDTQRTSFTLWSMWWNSLRHILILLHYFKQNIFKWIYE